MPNDASQYISGRTIALLATHVVTYVTEVAHHALVAREQERTLKAHKKVWRMNKESMLVSISCVEKTGKVLIQWVADLGYGCRTRNTNYGRNTPQ
jgi:hypothetical protein